MDPGESILYIGISIFVTSVLRILRASIMVSQLEDLNEQYNRIFARVKDIISQVNLAVKFVELFYVSYVVIDLYRIYNYFNDKFIIYLIAYIVSFIIYYIVSYEISDRIGMYFEHRFLNKSYSLLMVVLFITKVPYIIIKVIYTLILKIVKIPDANPKVTREQLYSMLDTLEEQGKIHFVEKEMMESVMDFNESSAEEIMTPRTEVFMIDILNPIDEYLDEMIKNRYSRIPVYESDVDNIIGVLYLKDYFLEAYKKGFNDVDIRKLLRPAYFVPELKNIHNLFVEMQRMKRHMAILMDEYGGFSGIITMDDLIEEIMGDLDDEFDADEPDCYELTKNTAVVQGNIPIKDINDILEIEIPEDQDYYDTIGGFIIHILGYIPNDNKIDEIDYENLKIRILEVEDRRIKKVKITVKK